jgi:hypothetical protein
MVALTIPERRYGEAAIKRADSFATQQGSAKVTVLKSRKELAEDVG